MIKSTLIDSTLAQYTAKEFSWLQDLIMTSGYFATQAGVRTFDVVEQAVPAMFVNVLAGKILAPFTKGGIAWKIICENVATESLAIGANSSGSNRVDAVIIKIDQVSNPDVLKTNISTLAVIPGTGISALSDGAIQTAIGANYSFIRLADITVASGATSITNANIAQVLSKISISPAVDINPDAINVALGGGLPYLSSDVVFSSDFDQQQTTQNITVEVGEANTTTKKNLLAQSFIPTKTKIRGVRLYKSANTGSFTGTVKVALQLDSSGTPSGSDLASVTISNAVYNALAVGQFEAIFSSEYGTLDKTKTYWIVVTCSTSDTSNHPNLGGNSAGGYANGITKYKNATDGWLTLAGVDLYFKTMQGITSQVAYIPQIPITRVYGAGTTTWNKPDGLKYIIVEVQAGGGGGGGGNASSNYGPGGGGGGGGYSKKTIPASVLGISETVIVGTGGSAGGSGGAGGAGNSSSFGAHCSATGGGGGQPGGGYFMQGAGAGGVGSGGDLNVTGQSGSQSGGGSGMFSGGGTYLNNGNNGGSNGTAGTLGAGGGGGTRDGYGNSKLGGAGGDGVIVITEYYI